MTGGGVLAIIEDSAREWWKGTMTFLLVQNTVTPLPDTVTIWYESRVDVHALHPGRLAMFLKLNLARSPERVEMPLKGCFGTRSTGKAAMNWVLFHRFVAYPHVFDGRSVGSGQDL